jgi:hypothetical protein
MRERQLPFVFRHTWLLFILVTCLQAAVWWWRAEEAIARNPQLEEGYRRLVIGGLVWGNALWVLMGVGIIAGWVSSTMGYFNPRNSPWVVVWYLALVALWIATIVWLFFQRGAEQLVEHPGLFTSADTSPWMIKAGFLICLAGGVMGLWWMITGKARSPSR